MAAATDDDRRKMLRQLFAFGAVMGCGVGRASAQPAGRAALPLRRPPMVVVDPGHGGADPGAISVNGVHEKDIVLPVAVDFARQLGATRRYRVVITRGADEFVPLRDRVARARAWQADLFLSIHADALPDRGFRGLSVFILSARASDREAAALAASENRADLVGGINLSRQPREIGGVLMELARRETGNLSIALARAIIDQLAREVMLRDHPQRSADFAVLTAPDIPSALVELGCLSNPQEERLLREQSYQYKLARGLVRAVEAYFAAHPAA
jgi:N-acetylmuramoyl-L-alanine amidase